MILICAVVYLAYRVYHLEKHFTKDYEREYGACKIEKRDPSEQNANDEMEIAKNMSKPPDRRSKQRHSDLSDGRNDY